MKKKFILLSFALSGTSGLIMGMGSGSGTVSSRIAYWESLAQKNRRPAEIKQLSEEEKERKKTILLQKLSHYGDRLRESEVEVDREVAEIKRLVEEVGPNTKVGRYKAKAPILVLASSPGYPALKLMQALLSIPEIKINAADSYQNTPLYLAAFMGHDKVVDLLLKAGADPLLKGPYDRTAREMAILMFGNGPWSGNQVRILDLLNKAERQWKMRHK